MDERIRQMGEFVLDVAREPVRRHGDDKYRRGFTNAAGISLRSIQGRLDTLKEQMKGPGLTKSEQAVYAQLDELKSEIEADCDRHWRGSGVHWRPLKPVAKPVIGEAGESESQE